MNGNELAALAAFAFAVGTVLQQRGALSTSARENDPRFLLEIVRKPVWLAGGAFQACGWVLQAMALDRGSLVVVQSLTALSLVIALPLGALLTDQHIGGRAITGALFTVAGITVFLSAGQPQGGTSHPSGTAWFVACFVIFVVLVALAGVGRRLSGADRALTLGVAAGLGFGLQAAVTKTFVTQIGGGVLGLFGNWSTYVLIISAVAGFVLQQSALKTGVLAAAMATSNSVTLFTSVILGVAVYGERLAKPGGSHGGLAVLGLLIAVGGIAVLAGSASREQPDTADLRPST